jgi:flagellar M-ring protein FliF
VQQLGEFWTSLAPRARFALGAAVAAILVALSAACIWLLRTDYQVLFTDLKPQDSAAMVTELERMKVPYRIGGDGNTIYVDASLVHSTRLKLMGKDIPLHGAAGFELFNNSDFGMTEFVQKVNYQRALQGEITRTILSLSEVQDARVHLALPEDGLFKRSGAKAKAAITLSMKPGESLRPEQVAGIQRLVAAAIPGVAAQDVTIIDQQGIALTRANAGDGDPGASAGILDLKRETEKMLARKATQVLERAFGAGEVLASVDVSLNMDHVRVTTEDVLPAPGHMGGPAAGVIVRERETLRDVGPPLGNGDPSGRSGNSQHEVDYQVGRRVEQVATQPGAIRRLHVVAVVGQRLDDKQLAQTRELVAAAVGAVPERGDSVVVQTLHAFGAPPIDDAPAAAQQPHRPAAESAFAARQPGLPAGQVLGAAVLLSAVVTALLAAWYSARRRGSVLDPRQREALLAQVQDWMNQPPAEDPRGRKGDAT